MANKKGGDFIEVTNPQGYINNREITNLPAVYLVKESRDCIIVNKEKVVSRKGFTLVGQAKDSNSGHKSSDDWQTSHGRTLSVRLNDAGSLEVYFEYEWVNIATYQALKRMNFAPWWADVEQQDVLLFVDGTDVVHMWSGGIARVFKNTSTTVTLQGFVTGTGFSFADVGGVNRYQIADTAGEFIDAGFEPGQIIDVSGSASNDGRYTIKTVIDANTISVFEPITPEAAGATVEISREGATWAESGFLTAGTRTVVFEGISYAYTGGEGTATLTGLTALPTFTAGDVLTQGVRDSSPSALTGLTLDLIAVFDRDNYVHYGDLTNRNSYMSHSDDYTDMTFSVPRAPGEGAKFTWGSTPTAFVPSASGDNFGVFGKKNDYYEITFELSSDLAAEEVRVKKFPTSTGQAAVSQGAVVRIKNGVAFLNFDQTIDMLSRLLALDTPGSQPLSYDIKNDLKSYDITDVHGIYTDTQMFFAFPREGLLHIYDIENACWQPPHYIPVGRFALIDIDGDGTQVLCAHSYVSNETYRLYDGYNDNGAPLRVEIHLGYENNGTRFTEKSADEFGTEVYMSENTNMLHRVLYDYKGASGVREFEIRGDDEAIRSRPVVLAGLGSSKHGGDPLGSLGTSVDDLSKYRPVDTTTLVDHFERQRVYIAEGMDIRLAIIATADNATISPNIPAFLKR